MPKRQRHHQENEAKEQIAATTRWKLFLFIAFLAAICLFLGLRIGEGIWPLWLSDHRKQLIGVILLIMVFLTLSSPLMVEVNSNPRHLSGLGKSPKGPWYP